MSQLSCYLVGVLLLAHHLEVNDSPPDRLRFLFGTGVQACYLHRATAPVSHTFLVFQQLCLPIVG
jgi:hypothetical protein